MIRGDGKDKFYRTLNLDEASRNALRFYREFLKKVLDKENEDEHSSDQDQGK